MKLKNLLKLCLEIDVQSTSYISTNVFLNVAQSMNLEFKLNSETLKFLNKDQIKYLDALNYLAN
jgi:hypothetical protein